MSDETPSIDEWRKFLIKEMSVLDRFWEQDLDDLWTFTPNRLARNIAEIADEFYQAYWDMFRATIQENDGHKTWVDMKREAKSATIEAQERVARAWAIVLGDKIDRIERDLESTKDVRVPLLKAKQLHRDAKAAKTKGEKMATKADYSSAIKQYRESMNLVIQSDDELEEGRRQAELVTEQQKPVWINIALTRRRVIIAGIATLAAIVSLAFVIYRYVRSANGGEEAP